tara:strand:+ start:1059 stop:2585 length:1527 start_codon:yes stop_codon:yes gene_type:complete
MQKIKLFFIFFISFQISVSHAVEFKNNKLHIKFDTQNAKVLNWKILNESMSEPHELIKNNKSSFGIEGSINGQDLSYWTQKAGGWSVDQNLSQITFELKSENLPFDLRKFWKFNQNSYEIDLTYELVPKKKLNDIKLYLKLGPGIGEKAIKGLGISEKSYSFTELIYKTNDIKTKRLDNKDEVFLLKKENNLQWIGLHSRYFLFLLRVNESLSNIKLSINEFDNKRNISLDSSLKIDLLFSDLTKNENYKIPLKLFTGTKTQSDLSSAGLEEILFQSSWNWMRYIILGIMSVLYWINNFVSNWGISIILLSILVRVVIHPIAKKSLKSQKEFSKIQEIIQPQIREIKKNFKGGEQSERILNVYEKYNTSPLASLKPLIGLAIQIPIFIALFHLLGQTFELKEASFLWIQSLAEPDKFLSLGKEIPFFGNYFNLLPFLMSITNLLSIKLNSTNSGENKADVKQNIILGIMTIGFFLLFYSFPSGMVLYWTMANILHLVYSLFSLKVMKV